MDLSKAINTNFTVTIGALPNIELFLTDAGIPDVLGLATNVSTRFGIDLPYHSDKVEYSPLILGFVVDEHYHSYEEIYRWVVAPDNYLKPELSDIPTCSIYVDILDNRKIATLRFEFIDCFPVTIGGLQFDHQGSADILQSTAEFRYSYFTLKRLQGTSPPGFRREPMQPI